MICFVDLPILTSITSEEFSFEYPRVVILESISEYWILIVFRYSKSSKCQATWFIPICSIEINFEYSLIDLIWFIDVSSILDNRVTECKEKTEVHIYSEDKNPTHSDTLKDKSRDAAPSSSLSYFTYTPVRSTPKQAEQISHFRSRSKVLSPQRDNSVQIAPSSFRENPWKTIVKKPREPSSRYV